MTDAEVRLWTRLRQQQMGVRFRRQQPVGPYIVDFYCAAAKLVVEVDGGQHGDVRAAYDQRRDHWLEEQGYIVVRFWNTQVLQNTDEVITDLMAAIEATAARSGDAPSPNPLPRGEGTNQSAATNNSSPLGGGVRGEVG